MAGLAAGAIERRVAYSASDKGRGQVVPLWDDSVRTSQVSRLSADNLRWQYHEVAAAARELHAKAKVASRGFSVKARRALPVPSVHVFQTLLAFFRTCSTFSNEPIERLELANEQIAGRLGLSRDCLKRALAYLGSHGVWYKGEKLYDGLGVLNRFRRVDAAVVDGQLQPRNRTAITYLTTLGKATLAVFKDIKAVVAMAATAEQAQRRSFKERWRDYRAKQATVKEAKQREVDRVAIERQQAEDAQYHAANAREWCAERGLTEADTGSPTAMFAFLRRVVGIPDEPAPS